VWGQKEVRHIVSKYFDNARAAEGYLIEAATYYAERVSGEWFRTDNADALFDQMSAMLCERIEK
jgi:hypothetical protein